MEVNGGNIMENVFALNMTDEENDHFDGQKFAVRRVSDELVRRSEEAVLCYDKLEKRSDVPRWISIVKYVSLILGVALLAGIVKAVSGEGNLGENLQNGFANAPYVFVICPILLVAFAVFAVYERNFRKTVIDETELSILEEESNNIALDMKLDLGIPADAPSFDVLCYAYRINKKGEVERYSPYATHTPIEMFIYRDEENIYIANYSYVYAFKISEIFDVVRVDEKITLLGWNKDEEINEGKYQEYKMSVDNYGVVHAKGYYRIVINSDSEEYGIDIPEYEYKIVNEIIK